MSLELRTAADMLDHVAQLRKYEHPGAPILIAAWVPDGRTSWMVRVWRRGFPVSTSNSTIDQSGLPRKGR